MRTFVTGASGFVGTWLTRHLEACGDTVYPLRDEFDIADEAAVAREAAIAAPQVIYHLAGLADVSRSWEIPAETFRVNALGTVVLLEVARKLVPAPPGRPRELGRGLRDRRLCAASRRRRRCGP